MQEFVFGWVRIIFLETLPNNTWRCRCFLIFFKGFMNSRLNYFLQFSSCGPWRVFSHSNSSSHRALGWYRHTSSSRQFRNILCGLEIFNYCPHDGNVNFHCSSSFLKGSRFKVQGSLLFVTYTIIQGIIGSEMLVGTGPLNGKCKKEKIKHDNKIKKIT